MGESKIITKPNGELFNPDLAQRAITFINMLKHTKGEWHGKNFDLLPWQTQIISDVFGTVKPNGYRQYNTAYVEIPKKQGKSELAAAVALYLLAGDGEWGAEVYGCAADRQQASIVFDVACQMVEQCPALKKRIKPIISQKRLVYLPLNSFYQVLSAESYTKHGLNVHGVIFEATRTAEPSIIRRNATRLRRRTKATAFLLDNDSRDGSQLDMLGSPFQSQGHHRRTKARQIVLSGHIRSGRR